MVLDINIYCIREGLNMLYLARIVIEKEAKVI